MEIKKIDVVTNKILDLNDVSYSVIVTNADDTSSFYDVMGRSVVFDLVCVLSESNRINHFEPPAVRLYLSV